MSAPTLFIGVVSYEGSRFAINQGESGLAQTLSRAIAGSEVQVLTQNLFDEAGGQVGTGDVQASLTTERDVERRWSAFLDRPEDISSVVKRTARKAKRVWQRAQPPSPRSVRRLFNIEMSHLELMRQGLDSRAPWILILEDDAWSSDIDDLALGLAQLMETTSPPESFGYANLSASFSPQELGIDHLLQQSQLTWNGTTRRDILLSSLPVTNTVCAILYSAEFLTDLLEAMNQLPTKPIVPIDWKLNCALMLLFDRGRVDDTTCVFVQPSPIKQLSMQSNGILPG